jgi:hypothetical protein
MPNSPQQAGYVEARKQFKQAYKELLEQLTIFDHSDEFIQRYRRAAEFIERLQRFAASYQEMPHPSEFRVPILLHELKNDRLNPEGLVKAYERWWTALHLLHGTWKKVPEAERKGLDPPEVWES